MHVIISMSTVQITEEGLREDKQLDEGINARMARLCLPAMNAINEGLVFTTEIPEEFPKCRLPTLDFLLWLDWWEINHSYFEKIIKTLYVVMQRTAMGEHHKYSILSNELVRRLSNINIGKVEQSEVLEVIEKMYPAIKEFCLWNQAE